MLVKSRVTPEVVKALAALSGLAVDESRASDLSPLLQIQIDGADRLLQWVDLDLEPDCRLPEVDNRGGQ